MTAYTMAKLLEAAPVVADAFARDTRFPTPTADQRVFNKATGAIERYTGSAWVPEFRTRLLSTGTLAGAAPYPPVASGAANFGPSTGQTALEFVNVGHTHRVRQNGTVTRLRVYLAATTGITGLYLKVWRLNGTTYDLVGMSANIGGSLTGAAINSLTLAAGVSVQEGDYLGLRVEYSAASVQNFFATTMANTTLGQSGGIIYSVLNTTPGTAGYDWAAQTATASKLVLLGVDMAAPVLASIGDSITSGLRGTCAFSDNYTNIISAGDAYPTKVAQALGYTYQNMGIGGQTASLMDARFAADIVALSPRIVTINTGVNDISGGVTNASIVASVTSMLNAAKAAGIVPVVIGTTPFRTGVGMTSAMMQQRDALLILLRALVTGSTYNGYFVDPNPYLGQFYLGGDAGNLWQLQARYDGGDGIHPNPAGYAALAQAVLDVLAPLAAAQPTPNLMGGLPAYSTGAPKTDTTSRRVAVLGQSADSTNQFYLTLSLLGAAAQSLRRATFQTAEAGVVNDGMIAFQPNGGAACVGQAVTNLGGNPFAVGYNFAKTDTTARRAMALAQSSDSGNPFMLVCSVTGAAALANRVAALQTADEGLANGGNLALQFAAGLLGVGTLVPSGAKVHIVNGGARTTDQTTAVLKAYSDLTKGVWMGYDNTNNYGLIGAVREGVAHDPLYLAPLGGGIGIGALTSTPTPLTLVKVYTPTLTPASVAAATVAEQTFTVTGLTTADKVLVNPPAIANATGVAGWRVSAADTLAIRFVNPTAGALTPTSGTYTVIAIRS